MRIEIKEAVSLCTHEIVRRRGATAGDAHALREGEERLEQMSVGSLGSQVNGLTLIVS